MVFFKNKLDDNYIRDDYGNLWHFGLFSVWFPSEHNAISQDNFKNINPNKYSNIYSAKSWFCFFKNPEFNLYYFDIDIYKKRMQAKKDRFNSLEDDCNV